TAMLTRGDIATKTNQPGVAREAWQTALKTLENYFPVSHDPEVIDISAKLLTRLGRIKMAEDAENMLARIDFHSPYPQIQ
ncbi:MAG: hypothetical protein HKO88_12410, partial [Xanthomonadales bacterium]|nr:hypothetical protein [Xanthomonadales bacterium]